MNSKPKSRVSIKNLFRIETGKKVALGLLVCAVVFGVYVGVHGLTSKAGEDGLSGPKITMDGTKRGNLRNISDIQGKDRTKNLGTPENPFVILELLPWSGRAMIGYQIDGCEPFDYKKYVKEKNKSRAWFFGDPGSGYSDARFLRTCFKDEYKDEEIPASWKNGSFYHSGEITLYGYYEKLDPGDDVSKQRFSISGYKKVKDGKYEPQFVKDDNGDFIWVSYGNGDYIIKKYDSENKYAQNSDGTIKVYNKETGENELVKLTFLPGDRQYTSRKDSGYYDVGNDPDENMWVPRNDFLREALNVYSRKEIEDYCVFVKVIEPTELNANPDWVDYADLIYTHDDENLKEAREIWRDNPNYRIVKEPTVDHKTNIYMHFGYLKDEGDSYWKTHQNDITWDVAVKIFERINGLGEYSGENEYSNGGNQYAPLIMNNNVIRDAVSFGYDTNYNTGTRDIDYTTMKCYHGNGEHTENTGVNNNVYKLLLMNLYMKPVDFYSLFFTDCEFNDNKPVIQKINGEGSCTIQENDKAKVYWNLWTFEDHNKLNRDKYNSNIFQGDEGLLTKGIFEDTYIFNNDNDLNAGIRADLGASQHGFKDALDWYNDESNIESGLTRPKDTLTCLDIVYYLLNYKKGGSPGNVVRRPNSFNVLDIEPCNDFSTLTEYKIRMMFPPSKYKSNIHIDRMTVAEFNSAKLNLATDYDVVYIGTDTGKLNTSGGSTKYNDTSLDGKVYTHVGDKFTTDGKTYRTSGNDFTTPALEKLKSFARGGSIVLLPDVFYEKYSKFSQSTYKKLLDLLDKTDNKNNLNVHKFLNLLNGDLSGAKNITCISDQMKSNAALATFVADTNTDFVVEKDSDGNEKDVLYKDSAGKYHMDFSFVIGECGSNKYKVKLLIDNNGDGVFTDDESGSEVVKTWPAENGTYGESSKKDGKYVPYKVTYDLPSNYAKGNVAWKFVIYNVDKTDAYIERTGVSVYDGRTKDTEINALQIVSDNAINDHAGNLEKQLNDAGSSYKTFIDDAAGYSITVNTLSVSQYREMFKDKDQKFAVDGEAHYYSSDLDDYNLFIVSCGDDLSKDITEDNINSTGNIKYSALAYLAYLDTADVGVIYTPNTVNGSNTASQRVIRDAFNLSRFTSAGVNNSMYTDITGYYQKSTGDYKTLSGSTESTIPELEYTYYAAMKNFSTNTNSGHYVYKDDIWKSIQPKGQKLSTKKATSIDRNNKGAVTNYPYAIDSNIAIKGTEAQQYQLNLNNPKATVWYSLADKEKDSAGKIKDKDKSAYGISPRDGSNNYYLYNAGNVFYSGINLAETNGDEEIKLFVNTMVAACGSTSKYPSVTIDKVIEDEKDDSKKCDPNLTKVLDKRTKKEYTFDARINEGKLIDVYKEYRPDATAEPTATVTPGAVATPEPSAKPTEKPITDPSAPADNTVKGKKVAVLYSNKFASSDDYYDCADAVWMKNLPDDAVLQIQYTNNETVSKDENSVIIEVRGNGAVGKIILKACEVSDSESEDIQKVNITAKQLKASLGSASNSISGITVRPYGWNSNTVILSARLIGSKYRGNYSIANKINSTGELKEENVKDIDAHTHRIFFTPYDGNLELAPIEKVSIALTDGMYGSETIAVPVRYVYRDAGSVKRLDSMSGGEGSIEDSANAGRFIKSGSAYMLDGIQYYIAYDKGVAKSGCSFIRFTIENGKHKSFTYVQVNDKAEQPKPNDVYMFDLD